MMLQALIAFCVHNGNDTTSLEMLRNSQEFPAFSQKVPAIMTWMAKEKLNKSQRRLLMHTAFSLLYAEKTRMNLACSARVMMREVHRLPALVDAEFPGYAKAGWLALIVREEAHVGLSQEDVL